MFTSSAPALLAVAAVLVSAGCGGDDASTQQGAGCPPPTPAASTDAVPADLLLAEFGTFTQVERRRGYVNAVSVTDGDVDTITDPVSEALEQAGYSIIAEENEVIEADIFFAQGQATTGGVKFINGPCAGQVTVRLFVSGG